MKNSNYSDNLKVEIIRLKEELNKTKQELSNSKEFLKRIEKNAKIGYWEFYPKTLKQFWSEEIFRILEYDLKDGAPDVPQGLEFIHPDFRSMAENGIQNAIQHGKGYDQEWMIITKKSNQKWVHSVAGTEIVKGEVVKVYGSFQDITDRKKAESKLKESEEKFKTIFNMSQSLICIADINTSTFKFINPAFEQVLGYSEEELLSKPFVEFIHPDDVKPTTDVVEKQLQAGVAVQTFENRYICKNEDYCWLNWNSYPIPEKGITYAIAYDVTELKKKEQALKEKNEEYEAINEEYQAVIEEIKQTNEELIEALGLAEKSEEKFKNIFNLSQSMICIADINTAKFKLINPAFVNILGYTEDELLSKPFLDFVHPDDKEATIQVFEKEMKAGKKVVHYLNRYRCKDNSYKWIDWNSHNIPEKGISYSVANDITELKDAEKALRQEKERAQQYLDVATVIMVSLDNAANVILMNPKGCEILGYSKEEILGMNWIENFLPPEQREEVKKVFIQSTTGNLETIEYYENEVLCKNGTRRTIAWHNSVLKDGDGGLIGVFSSGEDITERKKAENELIRNQQYLKKAQEIGSIGTWHLDFEKNILTWTEENYKIFEVENNTQMNYELFLECVHPDDREFVNEEWEKGIKNNSYDIEHRLLVSGKVKWVREKAEFITDIKGEITQAFGVTQDITESKFNKEKLHKTKREAKKSEDKYHKIIKTALDAFWLVDKDGKIVEANDSASKMLGYSKKELLKLSISEIDINEDYKITQKHIKKIIKKGWDRFESKHKRKDGTTIDVEVSATYLPSEDYGFIVFVQDITERKKAEAKIRERELEFRKLSANVPDLIFQFTRRPDGSYHVPIASGGIKNIFGCTPEDVRDSFDAIAKVLHPDDAERVMKDIEYSAKNLTYFTCEFRVNIPGKPVQWIFSRSSPEKLPDGSITWYGFNANITERKKIEEELEKHENNLEEIVKARTKELEEKNKELENFNELFIGREFRIKELKEKVKELEERLNN